MKTIESLGMLVAILGLLILAFVHAFRIGALEDRPVCACSPVEVSDPTPEPELPQEPTKSGRRVR